MSKLGFTKKELINIVIGIVLLFITDIENTEYIGPMNHFIKQNCLK